MSDEASQTPPLLRNRNFLLFMVNRTSNVIGTHSLTVAIGWHVYKLTRDPLDLGLIGLAQFTPALLLFLVAGMVADHFDRRNIMVICNLLHVVVVASLITLFWFGLGTVWPILAILAVHGQAGPFITQPVRPFCQTSWRSNNFLKPSLIRRPPIKRHN